VARRANSWASAYRSSRKSSAPAPRRIATSSASRCRFGGDPHSSHRQGARPHGLQEPGPGPRDDMGADHRDGNRHSRRRHPRSKRAIPTRALWPGHLRIAIDAGHGRGDRHGSAQDQGQGADDRRLYAGSAQGDLEWDVDRFRVKGNPEQFKTMSQIAWAAYNKVPPGMEPGLEAVSYYDPPNMTFSLRRLHLRHGYRRRHRRA